MRAVTTPKLVGELVERGGVSYTVLKYEPLGSAMNDLLLRRESDGYECWHSSHTMRYPHGSPLPARREVQRAADAHALRLLQDIRSDHIRDINKPWPGCEFGKAHLGNALTGAIEDVKSRLDKAE